MSTFKQLTFLGTSSGCPTAFRNVSASVLQFTDGRMWLFDCGEGTQHQVVKSGSSIAGANPWMALTTPPYQSSSISLSRIERIFITHLHGDHCYGLPGLMCTLSLTWQAPGVVSDATFFLAKRGVKQQQKAADTTKEEVVEEDDFEDENTEGTVYDHFSKTNQYLELYGPPGLAAYLRGVFRASEAGFGFQYRVHELVHPTTAHVASNPLDTLPCEAPTVLVGCEGVPSKQAPTAGDAPPKKVDPAAPPADALFYNLTTLGAPAVEGQIAVHSAYLSHRVTSVGYVLVEPATPGTLDMQACLKAGVPKGPLLAALKRGEDVTIPKSDPPVVVKAADVIGVPTPGRTFIHLGDTSCSDNIVTICQKLGETLSVDGSRLCPDYLVHESTFDDDTSILAVPRGHSTSRMAGGFAKQLGVKDTLILTHFSARYPPPHSATVNADGLHPMTVLLNQAKDEAAKDHTTASSSSIAAAVTTPNVIAAHDFMVVDLSRKQKSTAAASSDSCASKKLK